MNSNRSSCRGENLLASKVMQKQSSSKQSVQQSVRTIIHKKLSTKYCTCQNYMTINEINRALVANYLPNLDKKCVFKTTLNDIKTDLQQQKLKVYYPMQRSKQQLPQLIEYYKYYSQKSVLFIKEFFPMLFQYQQKRKFIEYNRLKALLNFSDSQSADNQNKKAKNQYSQTGRTNKSRIGISRNHNMADNNFDKIKGFKGVNVLDQLDQTQITKNNQHEQSLLINRLRNNLSKLIGPSKNKNLSLQQLDNRYDFPKKNDLFHSANDKNNFFVFPNGKLKPSGIKSSKPSIQQTHTNIPDEFKLFKDHIRRRSGKRNNSCENLARISAPKNPYEPCSSKLRRKKNFSMDNIQTNISTPYIAQRQRENTTKMKRNQIKTGQKQNRQTTKCSQTIMQGISDLKQKIKRQKQRMLKANNEIMRRYNTVTGNNFISLKREKVQYSSICAGNIVTNNMLVNTANQRFTKKDYEKLREKAKG